MKIKNQSRPIGKKQYKHACLAIAVGAMILPGAATAATVLITNHSFQDPVVLAETNREQTVGYIPGWTITRVAGTSTGGGHVSGVNVSGTLFGNPLTAPFDDTQFFWANLRNDGPTIAVAHLDSVSLGNLAANTVYTLNVATAARRTDFRSEITIGLLAGGVEVGTFTSTITAINTPSEVTTYTLDTLAAPTGVGDDMQIRIRMSTPVADADSFAQVAIDNVRLDATVIPEPSTALLGGLGMLALLRRRRS